MKKLTGLFLLTLALSAQARAATYNCVGDNNESLNLSIVYTEHNQTGSIGHASGTLEIPGVSGILEFSGSQVKNPQDSLNYDHFALKDQKGQYIDLIFSSTITFGGRCGRCTPASQTNYYAKVTTQTGELDFQCYPKFQ